MRYMKHSLVILPSLLRQFYVARFFFKMNFFKFLSDQLTVEAVNRKGSERHDTPTCWGYIALTGLNATWRMSSTGASLSAFGQGRSKMRDVPRVYPNFAIMNWAQMCRHMPAPFWSAFLLYPPWTHRRNSKIGNAKLFAEWTTRSWTSKWEHTPVRVNKKERAKCLRYNTEWYSLISPGWGEHTKKKRWLL